MTRAVLVLVALLPACGNSHMSPGDGGFMDARTVHDGAMVPDGAVVLPDGRVVHDGGPAPDGGVLPDGAPIFDASYDAVMDGRMPGMDGFIGTPCMSNSDCRGRICSSGAGGVGYCTWVCAEDVRCPDGGYCFYPPDSAFGFCLLECDPADPTFCPTGTVCRDVPLEPVSVCVSGCRSAEDCEPGQECSMSPGGFGRCYTPGSMEGQPCVENGDCPDGTICADEASTGFAGGICLRPGCNSVTGAGCSDSTLCVRFDSSGGGICLPRCGPSIGDCREGYECAGSPVPDVRVCLPRCTDDSQCTDGRICDFLTSRCVAR